MPNIVVSVLSNFLVKSLLLNVFDLIKHMDVLFYFILNFIKFEQQKIGIKIPTFGAEVQEYCSYISFKIPMP